MNISPYLTLRRLTLVVAILSLQLLGSRADEPAKVNSDNDRLLTLQVEKQLLTSKLIDGRALVVGVDHGIVTLSGELETMFQQDSAMAICRGQVPGVIAILDLTEVKALDRGDHDLARDLQEVFEGDAVLGTADIVVKVEDAVATLSGVMPNSGMKLRAAQTAKRTKGLLRVRNELKVEERPVTPEELRLVATALCRDSALLERTEVDVEVKDGLTILTGHVANAFQRVQAERLARRCGAERVDVRGLRIQSADREQQVTESQPREDNEIRETILTLLQSDPRTLSFAPKIEVEVSDGRVTLKGTVGHFVAQQAAERSARFTAGVRLVDNQILVDDSDSTPSDADLVHFTRTALRRDPYITGSNVIVDCEEAHVGLYGLVNSETEKARAERTARLINGVVHVDNNLAVRRKWVPKDDDQILQDLKVRLGDVFTNPDENNVTASVKSGVAMLEGAVDSWSLWQYAIDAAVESGAREPHSMVEVRYPVPLGGVPAGQMHYVPK